VTAAAPKGRLGALFLLVQVAFGSHVWAQGREAVDNPGPTLIRDAQTQAQAQHQRDFQYGIEAIEQGQYAAAAAIFEALFARTRSERVRLEWARSLYFVGDYRQSTKLFRATLASQPPLAVQERIQLWLDEMADFTGRWDYSLELVRDSNPAFIPTSRQFFLFGLPFTFQPTGNEGPQWGLAYRLGYSRLLDSGKRWRIAAGLGGREFSETTLDQQVVDLSLGYRFRLEPRVELQTFGESQQRGGVPFSDQAGVRLVHALLGSGKWRLEQELRVGTLRFTDLKYLNGTNSFYQLTAHRPLLPQQWVSVSAYVDHMNTLEKPYTYLGEGVSVEILQGFPGLRAKARLRISFHERAYRAMDPFFGLTRKDRRDVIALDLQKTDFRFGGFTPVLVLGQERNRSNIAIYGYTRNFVTLQMNRALQ